MVKDGIEEVKEAVEDVIGNDEDEDQVWSQTQFCVWEDVGNQIFGGQRGKKSLICLRGQSRTPCRGHTFLLRSPQQFPHLCLGPLTAFLS